MHGECCKKADTCKSFAGDKAVPPLPGFRAWYEISIRLAEVSFRFVTCLCATLATKLSTLRHQSIDTVKGQY